jgi:hypothetical protein
VAKRKPVIVDPVLCELEKVDRRKKSRANREQLRCCNWIQRPMGQSPKTCGGEGGMKVRPAGAGPKARSQNICPVHLIRARVCGARKNFFAKRRMRVVDHAAPPNKSASQKMEENLLCGSKMAAGFGSLEFG